MMTLVSLSNCYLILYGRGKPLELSLGRRHSRFSPFKSSFATTRSQSFLSFSFVQTLRFSGGM